MVINYLKTTKMVKYLKTDQKGIQLFKATTKSVRKYQNSIKLGTSITIKMARKYLKMAKMLIYCLKNNKNCM